VRLILSLQRILIGNQLVTAFPFVVGETGVWKTCPDDRRQLRFLAVATRRFPLASNDEVLDLIETAALLWGQGKSAWTDAHLLASRAASRDADYGLENIRLHRAAVQHELGGG